MSGCVALLSEAVQGQSACQSNVFYSIFQLTQRTCCDEMIITEIQHVDMSAHEYEMTSIIENLDHSTTPND